MNYFITPDLSAISGGNKYDKSILEFLNKKPFKLLNICLDNKIKKPLSFFNTINKIPKKSKIIIDGLLAIKMLNMINYLTKKYEVIILIHHPVSYENSNNGNIFLKLKERKLFSKAHRLITVSRTMKSVIRRMINKKINIDVVSPAVDCIYYQNPINKLTGHNIICIGSVIPRKNIEACITTLKYLDNHWTLTIIGSYKNDSYFKYLNNLIREFDLNKRVKFLGKIEENNDLINIIRKSKIYVCLSQYEGYGMANVEAASLGIPLVVSNLPVFHENLKGFKRKYVDINCHESIAQAIEDLSNEEISVISKTPYRWSDAGNKFKRVLNG